MQLVDQNIQLAGTGTTIQKEQHKQINTNRSEYRELFNGTLYYCLNLIMTKKGEDITLTLTKVEQIDNLF